MDFDGCFLETAKINNPSLWKPQAGVVLEHESYPLANSAYLRFKA
jgi:hypothetical protein